MEVGLFHLYFNDVKHYGKTIKLMHKFINKTIVFGQELCEGTNQRRL